MFKKFISYYKPHKVLFFFDMLASLLIAVIGMLYPIITRKMLNEYVQERKLQMIIFCGVALLIIYMIRSLLRFFVQYYGHIMGVKMQAQMRRELFFHLEQLPYSYYDNHETGQIMTRMTNDLMNVSELAHHGPENIFICGFTSVLAIVYLFTINVSLTLIILGLIPVLITITLLLRKKMNKAFMESRKAVGKINASLESSITGIRVTKAFANEEKEMMKFEQSNQSFVKARSKSYKSLGQFGSLTSFVTDLFNVILLLCGGLFIYYQKLDFVDYSTFIISLAILISPLTTLVNFVEQYEEGVTGFKRFIEILNECPESENIRAKDYSIQGEIDFMDVSFKYTEEFGILNHVNLHVNVGEVLALVGPSGGGKTTICHLIPRFYQINEGSIQIDHINLNDYSAKSLRSQIGIVQQDVFLFNDTIKENILYGRLDASDEEVIEAAKKANIHDYIMSLKDGYETVIGERGVRLSGGQKQRLSIARVFLKDPRILILDEATSALDNATEILIQNALDKLCEGRTTLIVAHRLSTIKNANRICVVMNGNIVESGTHNELLSNKGEYYNLYEAQFKNQVDEEAA